MAETTVVDIRSGEPFDLYIGRAHPWRGSWLPTSPFANRFKLEDYPLREVLRLYERHIRSRPDLIARLPELRGKRLGCWCVTGGAVPRGKERCHGQVLIRLLAELDKDGGLGARVPAGPTKPRGPRAAAATAQQPVEVLA